MIAVFDDTPDFCPMCGIKIYWDNKNDKNDFFTYRLFSCKCGMQYQYVALEVNTGYIQRKMSQMTKEVWRK